MNFEKARIRLDVLYSQLLHQHLNLMGAIIFAIRQHASKLLEIHISRIGGAAMGSVRRPGRLVGYTLRRNHKLVSLNRRRRHLRSCQPLVATSPLTSIEPWEFSPTDSNAQADSPIG